MNQQDKLNNFFVNNIKGNLKKNIVLETSNGGFTVFGKYNIDPVNNMYKVEKTKDSSIMHLFSDKKVALSWCIFDKFNSYNELRRISNLDDQLLQTSHNIKLLRQRIGTCKTNTNRDILLAKLEEEKYKKVVILRELQEYILKSNVWQMQAFHELETKGSNKN